MSAAIQWPALVLLLTLLSAVQMAAGRLLGLGPQQVTADLLLIVAVFLALRSNSDYTLTACWFVGLAKDLTSASVLGGYAISVLLVCRVIMASREYLYAENAFTMIFVTLLSALAVEHLSWWINVLRSGAGPWFSLRLTFEILFSALFTAAVSPYGQILLLKLHRQMGIDRKQMLPRPI